MVLANLTHPHAGSPFPPFPDTSASGLLRHAQALERILRVVGAAGEGTVLIVGHGATIDFVLCALCGRAAQPAAGLRTSGAAVETLLALPKPHVSLTALVQNDDGHWSVEGYGQRTVSRGYANSAVPTPKL